MKTPITNQNQTTTYIRVIVYFIKKTYIHNQRIEPFCIVTLKHKSKIDLNEINIICF